MTDFVESMFSTSRQVPWHGKGTVVDEEAVTAARAIELAGLDWLVELHPVAVGGIDIPDYWAVVRHYADRPVEWDKDTLGIVGNRYVPVQNHELFGFFDPVVDRDKGVFYHTGGSLKGGRIVWLLAKVPGDFYVIKDDRIENYILMCSSHDGSLHVTIKPTPIRVVCWNTLSFALAGSETTVRIKHTASAQYELQMAHTVLGLATKHAGLMETAAKALLGFRVTGVFIDKFLGKIFPSAPEKRGERPSKQIARRRERVEVLFADSQRNNLPGMKGTGWALYNAVTEYIDHEWPSRGDALYRSWMGSGEELKHKAFRLLTSTDWSEK